MMMKVNDESEDAESDILAVPQLLRVYRVRSRFRFITPRLVSTPFLHTILKSLEIVKISSREKR